MARVGLVINLRAQSLRKNSRGPWLKLYSKDIPNQGIQFPRSSSFVEDHIAFLDQTKEWTICAQLLLIITLCKADS